MSIFPLQQFEADLEADRKAYEKLKPPTTIVVRFGLMKMVGEFPYSGDQKPGCGSKIVVRTHRGVEMGEMLTSTCPNAGCSKSVTRKEMLEYIENSGGADYPFFTQGRALRVATVEDVQKQSALDAARPAMLRQARAMAAEMDLPMKIVEAEPILGGETLTFFFMAAERVDFREMVRRLAAEHQARIELRQVGARDEARLVADYERCGQHCCCKQFLKVLKPVSMRSAKVQKATLDPLKISGRCGRLMCCLRYEDETYETLRKRLPKRNKRVGTPEGPGRVIDSQILTQLVLVQLENENKQVAVPVEELGDPDAPIPAKAPEPDPMRGLSAPETEERADDRKRRRGRGRGRGGKAEQQDAYREKSQAEDLPGVSPDAGPESAPDAEDAGGPQPKRKRKRSRRSRKGRGGSGDGGAGTPSPGSEGRPDRAPDADGEAGGAEDSDKPRRRRRRRRRGKGGGSGGDAGGSSGGSSGGDSGGG